MCRRRGTTGALYNGAQIVDRRGSEDRIAPGGCPCLIGAKFPLSRFIYRAPRALDVLMITGSAGFPTVATMAVPPAVVPPVADPSMYIVTLAFVSRINSKLRFAVIACWGATPSEYTSQEPLLAQGQSSWSGRGSLEVSVLGSSFIRLSAAERQLGQTRR